ncbi:hypothetical protein BJ508DRAFT_321152 [Ascobolus immersus RN42]|uniref:Uncharacterized protein n=1 Tax=Ascobolus immersus RN42 TaxID=1160509 RepID=A0A3N4IMB8_ASCIM|nr:hypothetical protein BJ508DRAFT_321152 [Ascobolus immersus RN42]
MRLHYSTLLSTFLAFVSTTTTSAKQLTNDGLDTRPLYHRSLDSPTDDRNLLHNLFHCYTTTLLRLNLAGGKFSYDHRDIYKEGYSHNGPVVTPLTLLAKQIELYNSSSLFPPPLQPPACGFTISQKDNTERQLIRRLYAEAGDSVMDWCGRYLESRPTHGNASVYEEPKEYAGDCTDPSKEFEGLPRKKGDYKEHMELFPTDQPFWAGKKIKLNVHSDEDSAKATYVLFVAQKAGGKLEYNINENKVKYEKVRNGEIAIPRLGGKVAVVGLASSKSLTDENMMTSVSLIQVKPNPTIPAYIFGTLGVFWAFSLLLALAFRNCPKEAYMIATKVYLSFFGLGLVAMYVMYIGIWGPFKYIVHLPHVWLASLFAVLYAWTPVGLAWVTGFRDFRKIEKVPPKPSEQDVELEGNMERDQRYGGDEAMVGPERQNEIRKENRIWVIIAMLGILLLTYLASVNSLQESFN